MKDANGADTAALVAAWRKVLAQAKQITSSGASPATAGAALKQVVAPLREEAATLASQCGG